MVWMSISSTIATPFAYYRTINFIKYPPPYGEDTPESQLCASLKPIPPGLFEMSTIIFFVIPMIIMIWLYTQIGIKIRSRSKHIITKELGIRSNNLTQSKSRRSIIKMLGVVVVTFFIGWAPFHAQRVFYSLGTKDWIYFEYISNSLFKISGFFYYFSCTMNPIIYSMMSQKYRIAIRETLCGTKKRHTFISSTPRQMSRRTISSTDVPITEVPMLSAQLSDPFDAETGTFPRTRSMRLSQRMHRTASVRTNASVTSRATTNNIESKDATIVT